MRIMEEAGLVTEKGIGAGMVKWTRRAKRCLSRCFSAIALVFLFIEFSEKILCSFYGQRLKHTVHT